MHFHVGRSIKVRVSVHLPSTKKEATYDRVYPTNQLFNAQVIVILVMIDKLDLQAVRFWNESISKKDKCFLTIFHKVLVLQV